MAGAAVSILGVLAVVGVVAATSQNVQVAQEASESDDRVMRVGAGESFHAPAPSRDRGFRRDFSDVEIPALSLDADSAANDQALPSPASFGPSVESNKQPAPSIPSTQGSARLVIEPKPAESDAAEATTPSPPSPPIVEKPLPREAAPSAELNADLPNRRPLVPENFAAEENAAQEVRKPGEHHFVGTTATLTFTSGKVQSDVKVISVESPDGEDTIASITVEIPDAKGPPRKIAAKSLAHISSDGRPFEIRFDTNRKCATLFDVTAHLAEVAKVLQGQGHMLWPEIDESEQAEHVARQIKFLDTVGEKFPNMRLHETKYFLFYTNIPPNQVGVYINYLDAMYDKLCSMFGVPGGKNIWRGKASVIAFLDESQYHNFELAFMGNPNSKGSAGLHHGYSDGNVIISCFRGNDPQFFGQLLVHETTHGFLHRYKSNVHIPSWINEGIADWVGNFVVPECDDARNKQISGIRQLKTTGMLGPEFFAGGRLQTWQYGVASSMTDYLLRTSPAHYRALIDGIKEGKTWQESLKDAYGVSPVELALAYGQVVGVPLLRL